MLLACALVASNAFAGEQVRTETIKFQDLNVGASAGAEALYSRIHAAARHVCSSSGEWAQINEVRCITKAEARAVEKLNLPLLTVTYRMKHGGGTAVFAANR
jgi:UrcA family protein